MSHPNFFLSSSFKKFTFPLELVSTIYASFQTQTVTFVLCVYSNFSGFEAGDGLGYPFGQLCSARNFFYQRKTHRLMHYNKTIMTLDFSTI